jgi:hypothetical protein
MKQQNGRRQCCGDSYGGRSSVALVFVMVEVIWWRRGNPHVVGVGLIETVMFF